MKVGASMGVMRVDLKKSSPGNQKAPLDTPLLTVIDDSA